VQTTIRHYLSTFWVNKFCSPGVGPHSADRYFLPPYFQRMRPIPVPPKISLWQKIGTPRGVVLLIGLVALGLGTSSILRPKTPQNFLARVTFKLTQPNQADQGSDLDCKIINSEETRSQVVSELRLDKKWGLPTPQLAMASLAKMVTATLKPETNLLDINVHSPDPAEATDIAKSLGRIYETKRVELATQQSQQHLATLEKELAAQDKKVEEKRAHMLSLMQKLP
jgi:hypothetical protein